jgi:HPt (histidine-containing phosphotransfer) domain-containing protein
MEKENLVNLTSLRELLGDSNESILEILNLFVENIPPSIVEIKALLAGTDWVGLRKKVHSIKSYYGYVGNNDLNEKLNNWELGLAQDPSKIDHQSMMNELESKSLATVEQITKLIKDGF